ncbi:hypothetical protein NPIL_47521 [Nephila pilipes]|uniref:Uncharacterized protein n=1 Tax=Nephila pilipes TaxID=299642 RepID=A0A8X6T9J7_NEPPI|nr:hypothetical protein NPIL_47521 [Nephila pilipes]
MFTELQRHLPTGVNERNLRSDIRRCISPSPDAEFQNRKDFAFFFSNETEKNILCSGIIARRGVALRSAFELCHSSSLPVHAEARGTISPPPRTASSVQ